MKNLFGHKKPKSLQWLSIRLLLNFFFFFFQTCKWPLILRREGSVTAITEQNERLMTHQGFVLLEASGHYQRQDYCTR